MPHVDSEEPAALVRVRIQVAVGAESNAVYIGQLRITDEDLECVRVRAEAQNPRAVFVADIDPAILRHGDVVTEWMIAWKGRANFACAGFEIKPFQGRAGFRTR